MNFLLFSSITSRQLVRISISFFFRFKFKYTTITNPCAKHVWKSFNKISHVWLIVPVVVAQLTKLKHYPIYSTQTHDGYTRVSDWIFDVIIFLTSDIAITEKNIHTRHPMYIHTARESLRCAALADNKFPLREDIQARKIRHQASGCSYI